MPRGKGCLRSGRKQRFKSRKSFENLKALAWFWCEKFLWFSLLRFPIEVLDSSDFSREPQETWRKKTLGRSVFSLKQDCCLQEVLPESLRSLHRGRKKEYDWLPKIEVDIEFNLSSSRLSWSRLAVTWTRRFVVDDWQAGQAQARKAFPDSSLLACLVQCSTVCLVCQLDRIGVVKAPRFPYTVTWPTTVRACCYEEWKRRRSSSSLLRPVHIDCQCQFIHWTKVENKSTSVFGRCFSMPKNNETQRKSNFELCSTSSPSMMIDTFDGVRGRSSSSHKCRRCLRNRNGKLIKMTLIWGGEITSKNMLLVRLVQSLN